VGDFYINRVFLFGEHVRDLQRREELQRYRRVKKINLALIFFIKG